MYTVKTVDVESLKTKLYFIMLKYRIGFANYLLPVSFEPTFLYTILSWG